MKLREYLRKEKDKIINDRAHSEEDHHISDQDIKGD
jgi:hypothetical protein